MASKMQQVLLKTEDDVSISGNLISAGHACRGSVVLVHMMPETKESYSDFMEDLFEKGFSSLAIDLRGHGSSQGGPDGYITYSDEEHQKSIHDLHTAVMYMRALFPQAPTHLVGASIGANLSIQYAATYPDYILSVSALSPGLDYRGVAPKKYVVHFQQGQRVLFVTSEDDRYNVQETSELFSLIPSAVDKKMHTYISAGHGTHMFHRKVGVQELILSCIEGNAFHE